MYFFPDDLQFTRVLPAWDKSFVILNNVIVNCVDYLDKLTSRLS